MDDAKEPAPPLLEMQGIGKTFGSTRALSGVGFSVRPGQVHALMGENGAGKSTLMKILSGVHHPDPGGVIRIDGKPVTIRGPSDARALGIVTIYQELALAPNLTVAENLFLGREPTRLGMIDRKAMITRSAPVLARLGVPFRAGDVVATLSIAEQQLVEIARALLGDARILVMDEPTTSLSARETERLFAIVRQLRADGMAIVYISHRMAEIDELADLVSVLRDGRSVGTLQRSELAPGALIRMMVGRDLAGFYKKEHGGDDAARAVLLSVRDVADERRVHGCSLDVREGEVLGIAGLVGSGRTELARLICGIDARAAGTVTLRGKPLSGGPAEAIAGGLVYLTEDRKALGLYLDMSVRENINIGVFDRDARAGVLDLAAGRRRSAEAMQRLSVRASSDQVNAGSLSGGNQQKVLLARLLETAPSVLMLDEPTRGVDIGAKSEIYRLIDRLARDGRGVVVISSEMPEVIGICDRVLVMRDGLIAGELAAPTTQEAIMAIVAGVAGQEAA